MKQSIPRLRRARFKSGGELAVVDPLGQDYEFCRGHLHKQVDRAIGQFEDYGSRIDGYCLVIWDKTGNSYSTYDTEFGVVSYDGVPEFVRGILLNNEAKRRTKDEIAAWFDGRGGA